MDRSCYVPFSPKSTFSIYNVSASGCYMMDRMDGWMNGWMNGWMVNGWMDEW